MKKWMGFILILLMMLLLPACSGNNNSDNEDNVYKIYYIDTKTSNIVSEDYTAAGTTKEELAGELLTELRKEPESIGFKKALPDSVKINEYYFTEADRMTINFDTAYNDLVGIPEVLCRATIVKTLSQIKDLEYVDFNVNGQPLFVLMTDEDFIESTGTETYYKVSLFFANEAGDALIESSYDLYYTGTQSLEEMVIKQLINGPTEIGLYGTIPEGTTLLSVSNKDGSCYVDFNEKFLEKAETITGQVAIYSVVNSLVELPNINKVQFLINGAVVQTYREGTPFDGFFERNLEIIAN